MQINKSTVITILVTLIIGIGIGTLFFGGSTNNTVLEDHLGHGHELLQDETGVWICSMHPQVRQSEPGSCPFCSMALIPVGSEGDGNSRVFSISNEAAQLANIQTTIVGNANSESTLMLNGKLRIDERLLNIQTSHFGGRVEKLYKNFEGDVIRKGEPIASIYSPELVSAQEELIEAKKLEATNPVLLQAARKKLEYWKLSETQIKEIESSKIPIRNFDLLADYDGTVTNKLINTGDHIKQGEALLEVTDMSNLWVIFELYERDLNKVSLGQTLTFNTTSGNNLDTRISFIDNKVNPQSRIVEVRGNVRNDNGQLKPEMLIKAQLVTTNSENLTVPKSAVLWTGTRSIIYVKSEGELSFELRKIKLGSSLNNQYEVLEGLVAGEEVVTNGTFTLDAEAQLQGKTSMMSFNGKSVNNLKAKITFEEISFSDPKDYLNTTSSVFKSQLEIFFLNYIGLKDLMVLGNGDNIQSKTRELIASLSKIDMTLLNGEAHMYWMELLRPMQSSLGIILSTGNLDVQRLEFINLSKALINSVKSFGINFERTLYVQYCPMANDYKGAVWLSLTDEIINPYFGDQMLNCGNIEEKLN